MRASVRGCRNRCGGMECTWRDGVHRYGFVSGVLFQQRLETRVVADRVPCGIKTERNGRMKGSVTWADKCLGKQRYGQVGAPGLRVQRGIELGYSQRKETKIGRASWREG